MSAGGDQGMVVRLLGPIEALDHGRAVDLGAAGPRSLFAVLAMRANSTVTLDELVRAIWGEAMPKTAEGGVYTYVSKLRKALEPGRTRADKPALLLSSPAGYSLMLPPGSVDAGRFEAAAAEARHRWSADDYAGTLAHCDIALALWVGPPLGGAAGPFAAAERDRLELVRLDVQELRCAALIETGSAGDAAAALSVMAAANPLRERLHELLMLALYRTGRQAEGLEVYRRVRQQLVDDLGIEPGPALRRMHGLVLAGEADAVPFVGRRSAPAARVSPAQLPHSGPDFVGRDAEVRRLAELCASTTSSPSAVILAIDGAAGIGKTALAVHTALGVTDSFPDGQLFLDLRGFDPRFPPVTAAEALAHLLRGLGADPEAMKADAVAQAALYRSLLAGQRVLVVLDNAINAEQVRPLLPGSKGCLAIVTSRNRLAGLVARDGAARVSLDALRPAESLELLRRTLGAAAVDADPATARELAAQCGHLPLALRIAAEHMVGGNHVELGDMVDELRMEGDRLDRLSNLDDESSVVRSVFSWSYHALKPEDARAFRLLGLHPSIEVGASEASVLLGTGVPAARRQLDSLVRWHLLEQTARDRYRFHDLLRIYAAERAAIDESPAVTRAAIERLLGWYLGSVVAAREVLAPGFGEIEGETLDTDCPPLAFGTYDEAIAWAGRELPVLIDVLRLAAVRGFDGLAARLAAALAVVVHCTSRWTDWLTVIEIGLAAARRAGDRLSQGRLCNDSGVAYHFLGRHEEAVACHAAAISILSEIGDRRDHAIAINLAVAYSMMGRHLDALPLLEEAMRIVRERGNRFIEASIAGNLGAVLSKVGRHAEAIEYGRRGVALAREAGPHHLLGHALTLVGDTCLVAGQTDEAIRYFDEALALWRRLDDRWGEVRGLHALAKARQSAGLTDGVGDLLTAALATMQEAGYLTANEREADEIRALLAELG